MACRVRPAQLRKACLCQRPSRNGVPTLREKPTELGGDALSVARGERPCDLADESGEAPGDADEAKLAAARDFAASIREAIETLSCGEDYPTIRMTAELVGLSVRPLQRRLAQAGTSHHVLVAQARFATAAAVLERTDAKILELALDLGYSDHANFELHACVPALGGVRAAGVSIDRDIPPWGRGRGLRRRHPAFLARLFSAMDQVLLVDWVETGMSADQATLVDRVQRLVERTFRRE